LSLIGASFKLLALALAGIESLQACSDLRRMPIMALYEPGNTSVGHLLGRIYLDVGRNDAGAELIDRLKTSYLDRGTQLAL